MQDTATREADAPTQGKVPSGARSRRRLLLFVPPLLGALAAAVYVWRPFTGVSTSAPAPEKTMFVELPEMITNLNNGNAKHPSYVKLHVQAEVANPTDAKALTAAMPRLVDLFQTYVRETRPDELRGSAGTYRLKEELLARANIALAPVRVRDLLFADLVIQ